MSLLQGWRSTRAERQKWKPPGFTPQEEYTHRVNVRTLVNELDGGNTNETKALKLAALVAILNGIAAERTAKSLTRATVVLALATLVLAAATIAAV